METCNSYPYRERARPRPLSCSLSGKLAYLGYRTRGKKLPPEAPKPSEPEKEPVYYIVEKKKKRVRSEYSEPKRISFNDPK